jgi:hypothetical protein
LVKKRDFLGEKITSFDHYPLTTNYNPPPTILWNVVGLMLIWLATLHVGAQTVDIANLKQVVLSVSSLGNRKRAILVSFGLE